MVETLPTGPALNDKLKFPDNRVLYIHSNSLFYCSLLGRINHLFSLAIAYILSKKILTFCSTEILLYIYLFVLVQHFLCK